MDSASAPFMGNEAAYLPLEFYLDFLRYLRAHDDRIEIITYDDLAWDGDDDYTRDYPRERAAWAAGRGRTDRVFVLIQHDVDSRPERTMAVLKHEEGLGVRSNVMIFAQRVDRRHLAATGECRLTPYDLDRPLLKRLAAAGFVIGYHSNAYEQARFDAAEATRVFERDVAQLARDFDLRYFSAHGGAPGPDGRNNKDVPFPASLHKRLRWVHNGHSPWFAATYSDGGINSPHRDPTKRDLRDFVRTWRPGLRYRVLTHPQYYETPCGISPRLAGTPWYDSVRSYYAAGGAPPWDDVPPPAAPSGRSWATLWGRARSLVTGSHAPR